MHIMLCETRRHQSRLGKEQAASVGLASKGTRCRYRAIGRCFGPAAGGEAISSKASYLVSNVLTEPQQRDRVSRISLAQKAMHSSRCNAVGTRILSVERQLNSNEAQRDPCVASAIHSSCRSVKNTVPGSFQTTKSKALRPWIRSSWSKGKCSSSSPFRAFRASLGRSLRILERWSASYTDNSEVLHRLVQT